MWTVSLALVCLVTYVTATTFCSGIACGGATDECCGNRCFNPATHHCVDGFLCAVGNGVCGNGQCYDPTVAVCYAGRCFGDTDPGTMTNDFLCGAGLASCMMANNQFVCYDPNGYFCNVGTSIAQRPPGGALTCGVTPCNAPNLCCVGRVSQEICYNPRNASCQIDPKSNGVVIVCPFNSLGKTMMACQTDIHSVVCFDPDVDFCCHANGSPNGVVQPRGTPCLNQHTCS